MTLFDMSCTKNVTTININYHRNKGWQLLSLRQLLSLIVTVKYPLYITSYSIMSLLIKLVMTLLPTNSLWHYLCHVWHSLCHTLKIDNYRFTHSWWKHTVFILVKFTHSLCHILKTHNYLFIHSRWKHIVFILIKVTICSAYTYCSQ